MKLCENFSRQVVLISVGNFMTHPLRLYRRKLSGRIDYSHIERRSVYWKKRRASAISRSIDHETISGIERRRRRVSHFFTCERRSSSDTFSFRCSKVAVKIFIQPEDLSFDEISPPSSSPASGKDTCSTFSFCRNELRFAGVYFARPFL